MRKVEDIWGWESDMTGMGPHGLDNWTWRAAMREGSQSLPCPQPATIAARRQMIRELPSHGTSDRS